MTITTDIAVVSTVTTMHTANTTNTGNIMCSGITSILTAINSTCSPKIPLEPVAIQYYIQIPLLVKPLLVQILRILVLAMSWIMLVLVALLLQPLLLLIHNIYQYQQRNNH